MATRPLLALLAVAALFLVLAGTVAALTPPWEANDEQDHVRNVQSLTAGRMYRITPDGGIESHQAPLYYALLAGWQRLLGIPPQEVAPQYAGGEPFTGIFVHDTARDGADQRLVGLLRLPGLLAGVAILFLTAATARLLTTDPWTPVVAAALVAGVPRFVFLHGVVNNDTLANLIGAAAALAAVWLVARRPVPMLAATAVGLLVGFAFLTKVTAAAVALPLAVALALAAPRWRTSLKPVGAMGATALVAGAPWLAFNAATYGDPLALRATVDHLRVAIPGLIAGPGHLDWLLNDAPMLLWKSTWYTSGWNQFNWKWWAYVPFWLLLLGALAAWVFARRPAWPRSTDRAALVLAAFAVAGIAAVGATMIGTTQAQARVAFFALPAVACLVALGLERWKLPVPFRFVLPALGFIGTVFAIRSDVVAVFLAR